MSDNIEHDYLYKKFLSWYETPRTNETFRINNKYEFLVTYASTFDGALPLGYISEFFSIQVDKKTKQKIWEHCESLEFGHEKGIQRDHYHVYLKYIGPNKRGFSTTNVRIWDIPLKEPVVVVYYYDEKCEEFATDHIRASRIMNSEELANKTLNHKRVIEKYLNDCYPKMMKYEILTTVHPNIRVKGYNKDECKDSFNMISYIIKQQRCITSTFDIDEKLKELEKEFVSKNSLKTKKNEIELEFSNWLRNKKAEGYTISQVKEEIFKNEQYHHLYRLNFNNNDKYINEVFKKKDNTKPIPHYGVYYVHTILYDYIMYVNDFIKSWYEDLIDKIEAVDLEDRNWKKFWEDFCKKHPERPKSLYLKGGASSGKTSLIRCLGDCSYWCNGWNYDKYELRSPLNFFDDYDNAKDKYDDWSYLKPWMGGQQVVHLDGKWRMPDDVPNHKPCIFVSNYNCTTRFPSESAQSYIKRFGVIVDEYPDDVKLYEKPETRTIGGFALWKKLDTRELYWYKRFIEPTLPKEETIVPSNDPMNKEQTCNCGDRDVCSVCWNVEKWEEEKSYCIYDEMSPELNNFVSSPIINENKDNEIILLDDNSEDENKENVDPNGRPKKRNNPFEILQDLVPAKKHKTDC